MSANDRRAPVLRMAFLFGGESCHRGAVATVRRRPGPSAATRARGSEGAHAVDHASRPGSEEARLRVSRTQTWGGRGAPTRGKDRGTGADPGSIAPECALETSLPPSCLRATVPRGEEGEECVLPFHLFCLLLSATGRGKRGAPPRAPCPGALASRSRAIAQQEALPFLAPSFQPFSGRHRKRMERIRKKPRGAYLHFL